MSAAPFFILGPCSLESEALALTIGEVLAGIAERLDVEVYFKASYDKANRTRVDAWRGPGIDAGLRILENVRAQTGLPVLTDVHSPEEAAAAGAVVDVLQVPAFLCRQTDLLVAAGATGRPVNIKKGQFMHPEDMIFAAEKVLSGGASDVWLCERGTSFGHGDLVVDPRSIVTLVETAARVGELGGTGRVVMDATHAAQQRASGGQTGGQRRFVEPLARAAIALGAHGIFAETHPTPDTALSDAATQWPLADLGALVERLVLFAQGSPAIVR